METYEAYDKFRLKRKWTEEAIRLAMANKWDEAADANLAILEIYPDDRDARNRVGKAWSELGRYAEARDAYAQALELDPHNTIARRNHARMEKLAAEQQASGEVKRAKADPSLFIAEMGKTGVVTLENVAPEEKLTGVGAGDLAEMKIEGASLCVLNVGGDCLGTVEPRLARRLMRLMQGGNRYTAAVVSVVGSQVRVILRETYQHPSQAGRVSFPSDGGVGMGFRPYIRGSLLRYGLDDASDGDEDEEDEGTEDLGRRYRNQNYEEQ